jgi:hypothetical protein
LRMNACLWTILLLHQCIVRNFSNVDTRWVANFSWDYCKLFFTMPIFSCKNEIAQGNLLCLQFRNLLRMLTYKTRAYAIDEYSQLAKNRTMEFVKWHVHVIVVIFQQRHLWKPMRENIKIQLNINVEKGFSNMFTSLDCMHSRWKNCWIGWQRQFKTKMKKYVHNFENNCKSILLDMTCIFCRVEIMTLTC